jgi:hypothetical protein
MGELTTGSPTGGPVLISMRFSGSSSSGASSGITTTGLMCSARAEALRKLGGPCRGSRGSCSAQSPYRPRDHGLGRGMAPQAAGGSG